MIKKITTPLNKKVIKSLRSGDEVLLTGYLYTARDVAHKRMIEAIKKKKKLPFDIKEQVIFYVGPTPEKPGQVIGSCGPTTSGRMDDFTEELLAQGLAGVIGKGQRDDKVVAALKKHKGIYFVAVGGAGALLAKKVKSSEIIAYDDLGTEAIRKLYVKDFPVIVAIDSHGSNLYKDNRSK